MKGTKSLLAILTIFICCTVANAQKAEVTVSLNEAFFDALLESVFQNFDPLEFTIANGGINRGDAEAGGKFVIPSERGSFSSRCLTADSSPHISKRSCVRGALTYVRATDATRLTGDSRSCKESVRILREMNGVRTAVRFRDGKIVVPLAFSGNYAPPFVGCVEFAGWAETNIDLEFDRDGQRLVGRARVLNVNLNGTGGVGGTVIAKLIQRSIDKKLNPIEIIRLDKLSFAVPVQNGGTLRMKALSARPEIAGGFLNIHVMYELLKG